MGKNAKHWNILDVNACAEILICHQKSQWKNKVRTAHLITVTLSQRLLSYDYHSFCIWLIADIAVSICACIEFQSNCCSKIELSINEFPVRNMRTKMDNQYRLRVLRAGSKPWMLRSGQAKEIINASRRPLRP